MSTWALSPRARVLAIAVCLVAAEAVAAAAPRVAALTPALKPAGAPELRDRFHDAVTRGLAAGGVEVVPAGEVRMRLAVSEEQLNCTGPGVCAARAALTLRTDHLVATEVSILGKDYQIKTHLLDNAGREVAKVEDSCDICTIKEADDAIARAVIKLVTTNKAALEAVAAAPVEKPAPPPKPVEPPKPAPVVAAPAPAPTPAPAPAPEKKLVPWRWIAIGAVGLGVVGLAIGIPLVVIDGRPTCSSPDPVHTCPEVYNTVGGGGVMLALGVAGLATAGVSFYLDWRQRHRPANKVSLVPTLAPIVAQGPAGATVQGGVLTVGGRF